MMKKATRGVLAAGFTVAMSMAGLGFAGPAQAASCPANTVCLYENKNLGGGYVQRYTSSGTLSRTPIPVADLYDCKRVRIAHGNASSGTNNTKFAFELMYINPGNIDDQLYVGTMAPYKSYNGFGAGDDDTNYVFSPGC